MNLEKKNFKPFSFYTSKNKAKYAVELTEESNYQLGNKFNIKNFK